jgi:3'-5' exoribonuclease
VSDANVSHAQANALMSRRPISQLQPQEQIDQTFRATDKQLRANRQGGKYVILRLADRSGTLTGMLWNADDAVFASFERGDYVRCAGRLQLYNGALQMIVTTVEKVDPSEVDAAEFERFDASAAAALNRRLRELAEAIETPRLRELALLFVEDEGFMRRFEQASAAVSHHHAYPGGLLQHTVDLMELAVTVAPRYPRVDRDLVVLGAMLHDLGKTEELSVGEETVYTDRGQLVGHIVIGVQLLADKIAVLEQRSGEPFPASLRWQIEHLIVSHHGQLEFGSPKLPQTLEAILLHHLDNLDAKMAAAICIIEADVGSEGHWTQYNPAIGRKLWKAPNSAS